MKTQMSGTHQATYNAVFQHPIAHIQWQLLAEARAFYAAT
jgi:hypothetical protein